MTWVATIFTPVLLSREGMYLSGAASGIYDEDVFVSEIEVCFLMSWVDDFFTERYPAWGCRKAGRKFASSMRMRTQSNISFALSFSRLKITELGPLCWSSSPPYLTL